MPLRIRAFVADDQPLVRLGIRTALEQTNDIRVVGEAAVAEDILAHGLHLQPDVFLLSQGIPDFNIVEAVAEIRAALAGAKVLIAGARQDPAFIRALVEAGAEGSLLKDDPPEDVVQAVRLVMRGQVWYSQELLRQLLAAQHDRAAYEGAHLSPRDRQILVLLAQGRSNAQIGEELHLTRQTIKNYVSRIYRILGISSRAEAIAWAIQRQIAPEPSDDFSPFETATELADHLL